MRIPRPGTTALILAALVLFGGALRMSRLSADPPLRLSWSQAPFTDGARVVDGARNEIVHGRWIVDPRNPAVAHYPLSNLLVWIVFRLFGVGLAQAGLLSALAGTASLAALAWLLARRASAPAAIMGTAFFAVDYQMVMYDRLPMSEALMISLMVVATVILVETLSAPEPRARGFLASGLAVGLSAFFVKLHALLLLVSGSAAIYGALGEGRRRLAPRVKRALAFYAAGVLAMAALWFLLVILPERGDMARFFQANVTGHYNYGNTPGEGFWLNLGKFLRKRMQGFLAFGVNVSFLWRTLVAAVVSFSLLIGFLHGFPGRMRRMAPLRLVLFLWLGIGVLALSLLDYRPDRYHMMLLPPISALAGLGLADLREWSGTWKPRPFSGRMLWILPLMGLFLGFQIVGEGGRLLVWHSQGIYNFLTALKLDGDAIMNTLGRPTQGYMGPTLFALTTCALFVPGYLLWRRRVLERGGFSLNAGRRETLVLVMLSVGLAWQLGQYLSWWHAPKYTLRDTGRDLGTILSPGATVVGSVLTTLCLENRLDSVPIYGDIMRRQDATGLGSYPVTHVLYREPALRAFLDKKMPDVVKGQVFVRSYTVAGQFCELWRVPGWPGSRDRAPAYQPSLFEQGIALLQDDRYADAIPYFEEFLRAHPDHASTCIVLGACYSGVGRRNEALALFERAVVLSPYDAAALEDLGDLYLAAGQAGKAGEMWTRSLRLEPGNEELAKRLAEFRGSGGRTAPPRGRYPETAPKTAPTFFEGEDR